MPGEKLSPGIAIRVRADLPASATTTAGATAATEAATTATEATAAVSAATISRYRPATAVSNAAGVTAAISIAAAPIVARTIATESISIAAAEPGAGTDEQTADKVVRSVVSIRSAIIRVIPVIAVRARRRRIHRIRRRITNADPDTNLSLRGLNAQRKK
jgi:hypothetical protein